MAISTLREQDKSRKYFIRIFSIIPISFYTLFLVIPLIIGVVLSFFSWKGLSLKISFVGLKNFKELFSDAVFFKALYNHMWVFISNTLIVFVLALTAAIVLSRSILREKNFYRVIYFFPTTVPMAVINAVWMGIYNPTAGVLNSILSLFGIAAKDWLGFELVKGSVVAVMAWKAIGFYMVLFMAAISNIPDHFYEAAKLDGCGEFRQTFVITIPLIWEVIRTSLVFFVVTSCSVGFQVVYMLTRGGPDRSSELLTTYMYQQAFNFNKFGYGAAIGVAILCITMVLSFLILKLTDREVYEY